MRLDCRSQEVIFRCHLDSYMLIGSLSECVTEMFGATRGRRQHSAWGRLGNAGRVAWSVSGRPGERRDRRQSAAGARVAALGADGGRVSEGESLKHVPQLAYVDGAAPTGGRQAAMSASSDSQTETRTET